MAGRVYGPRVVEAQVATIVCCSVCDTPVIRIPAVTVEYIDHEGEISAVCGEHK